SMKKIIVILLLVAGFAMQIDCVTRRVRTVPAEEVVYEDEPRGLLGDIKERLAGPEEIVYEEPGYPVRTREEVVYVEPGNGVVDRTVDAAADVADAVIEAPARILGAL